jgi:hypothetical protein
MSWRTWIATSFRNPHNLPQYLIAVFTLALAFFAWKAWVAAQDGTAALQGQLDLMKRDERPWIGLDRIEGAFAPATKGFKFSVVAKNSGKSPALNVHGGFHVGPNPGNDISKIWPTTIKEGSSGLMLPGTITVWNLEITDEQMRRYVAHETDEIIVYGRIDYDDVDGQSYCTKICRYYDKDMAGGSLAICKTGNEICPDSEHH